MKLKSRNPGTNLTAVGVCLFAISIATVPPQLRADIPAPPAGGPRPTVELSAASGYALQSIGVSGAGASGYSAVRIVILIDVDGDAEPDRSRLLTTTSTGGGDTFATSFDVPDDIAIGPTMICAAVDADTAEFACEPFEVITPPAASITGTIGAAATEGDTELLVYDAATGDEVAAVLMSTAGGFAVSDLPPGTYEVVVAGEVIEPLEIAEVLLTAGDIVEIDESDPTPSGEGLVSSPTCGLMAFGVATPRISGVTSDVHGHQVPGITGIDARNIGRFIAGAGGPPLAVTFTAKVQSPIAGASSLLVGPIIDGPLEGIDGVRFRIVDSEDNFVWEDVATNGVPFTVTHPDVSSLAPGRYVIGCQLKHEDPTREALLGVCWGKYAEFLVLPNPTDDDLYSTGGVTWIPDSSRYFFFGWMPYVNGLLSAEFPEGGLAIPYLGDITSGFDAGVYVSGYIDLDGHVEMTYSRLGAEVYVLGRTIYNEDFLDFLDASTTGMSGAVFGGPLGPFGEQRDPTQFAMQTGPHLLYDFFQTWPVWSGRFASFWGLIVVRVSVDLALYASAYLHTTQQPLDPRLGATLTPEALPSLNVAVSVKLLLGLAKGRADVRTEAILNWPVEYDSDSVPNIFLDDPCLGLRMTLTASARILRKKYTLSPQELFCEDNGACGGFCGGATLRGVPEPVRLPDAYASPAVAAGPGGRVLTAYVEDTNSNGTGGGAGDPDQTVIARFWNAGASTWGMPLIVSDQQFAASDPVIAFTGSDGDAWVIYTQNTIDEDAGPAPEAVEDIVAAQEIVAAFWDDSSQSFAHEFLTSDGVPIGDGSAAIDADTSGVTVAWMRDLDGDIATRNDWTVAVRNWIDGFGWDEMELLDASTALDALLGGTSDALNAEVAVVRDNDTAYLIWTADADADIDTHDDRRIVLAVGSAVPNPTAATPHYFTWQIEAPASLPAGAEQPSADINPQTGEVELALTVRGKDADGLTDAGVGTSNLLWHAKRNTRGAWSAEQLLDDGMPIRSEAPQLRVGLDGRVVIFMRRFDGSTPGKYRGQLAMMVRGGPTSPWSNPAWVTEDWNQHWDQALAVDTDGKTFLLDVNRLDAPPEAPAVTTNACLPVLDLNDVDEPVQCRILPAAADPQLDEIMAASRLHAEVGADVTVTATVRNAGMVPATNVRVQFFDGPDALSPLLDEVVISGSLAFNEPQTAEVIVQRQCGPQPIFARLIVDAPGDDRCDQNDEAQVLDIGLLSPPLRTSASISTLVSNAIEVTAVVPDADAIGGYRFLRGTSPGGPYENIGESVQPVLTDRNVTRGVTYYYTVIAYDDCGTLSPRSVEASIQIPVIVARQWAAPLAGTWHNPVGWSPAGTPGDGDDLAIVAPGTYTVTLGQDAASGSLVCGNAPGTKTLNLNNRTLSLLKPSLIAPGGKLQSTGGTLQLNQGMITNQGVVELLGPGNLVAGALVNDGVGQIQVRAANPAPADLTVAQGLANAGQITLDSAGFPASVTLDIQNGILANGLTGQLVSAGVPGPQNVLRAALRNEGNLTVNKDLVIDEALAAHVNLGLISVAGGNLTFTLAGPNARVANAGQIDILPGRQLILSGGPLNNGGQVNIAGGALASIAGPFTQHTGTTTCDGTLSASQIDLKGGALTGAGQVAGTLNNIAADVEPGASPGTLTASSGYIQGPAGRLHVELAGLAPGTYDVLSVTGDAILDGVLSVELIGGFNPPLGATFDILTTTAGTVTGEFAEIVPPVLSNVRSVTTTYLPDRVRLTVVCARFDSDCDGDIDGDDYTLVTDCLAGPSATPNPTPPTTPSQCLDAFDTDADNDVDLLDCAGFTEFFTGG